MLQCAVVMLAVMGGAAGWCGFAGGNEAVPAGKAFLHIFSLAKDAKANVVKIMFFFIFTT